MRLTVEYVKVDLSQAEFRKRLSAPGTGPLVGADIVGADITNVLISYALLNFIDCIGGTVREKHDICQ